MLQRSADLVGPFSFKTVLVLLAVNAWLLIVLVIAGLVDETSAQHSIVWRRVFTLTQGWLIPLILAGLTWLTTAVAVLHFARDRHAEAAGWLLLGIMFLAALPMIGDLDFTSATARVCWIAMTIATYGVGMIAVDRTGSPEEIHRTRDSHQMESVDRLEPMPMPVHGR
ncbi:hypothetical protein ABZU32_14265 [Sphaerisporangium sp. NPDC005288]|uniref:hypothetical protein n=1 Tax=Sphaerisporangium sp. NPDC005288 TaxID=3155114 RepID=UPI0033B2C73C